MKSSSEYDIVVYGATGFTGQLIAEYLATHYRDDASLKWAMAGRSMDKLKSVRDAIGARAACFPVGTTPCHSSSASFSARRRLRR